MFDRYTAVSRMASNIIRLSYAEYFVLKQILTELQKNKQKKKKQQKTVTICKHVKTGTGMGFNSFLSKRHCKAWSTNSYVELGDILLLIVPFHATTSD